MNFDEVITLIKDLLLIETNITIEFLAIHLLTYSLIQVTEFKQVSKAKCNRIMRRSILKKSTTIPRTKMRKTIVRTSLHKESRNRDPTNIRMRDLDLKKVVKATVKQAAAPNPITILADPHPLLVVVSV